MHAFLSWLFQFLTTMFSSIWNGIVSFLKGIIKIFDFGTYFGLFGNYQEGFGFFGWVLAILSFLLVYAFWAGVIVLIVIGLKKFLRFRATVVQNDNLLEEIATLHNDVDRLVIEKQRIMELKLGPGASMAGQSMAGFNAGFNPYNTFNNNTTIDAQIVDGNDNEKDAQTTHPRFFRLGMIDEKYVSYTPEEFDDNITLSQLCEEFRNYACSQSHLFYDLKTIRFMFAGLSTTKLVILQGISGTGKTSLPYCLGKYFENPSTIASVQPSWKDRSELFGFYNEFTKKFNETEVLCRIYESQFEDSINVIILDELNIARIEYYFAEMLSILELPDHNTWNIQLVPSVWDTDPIKLADGRLHIPDNIWYIGTANNDDSTYSISDKVYDRAFVINLNSKGVEFEAPLTPSRRVSYSHVAFLYEQAQYDEPLSDEYIAKIEQLDNYVIDHFRVAFGNRIMKQVKTFVPVYKACGGDELEALDYMLCTKVFRKFESLNLVLIRDEIKGLINQLDNIFGKDKMVECITFLRRLQKSF